MEQMKQPIAFPTEETAPTEEKNNQFWPKNS